MATTDPSSRLREYFSRLKRKRSLTLRVFEIFSLFILTMAAVLTFLFLHYQVERVREDLETKGRTVAAMLAGSARVGVFAENIDLLNDVANVVMNQKEVLSVSIYSSDGRELLKRVSPAVNGMIPAGSVEFIEQVVLDQAQTNEEMLYFGTQPVKSEKIVIGQVKVVLDSSMVARGAGSVVARNFIIAAIFFIIGTLYLAFSLKRTLGPLSQLTEEVRLLGEGKETGKISVSSEDEIGRLATAFNDMAENLKKREEETATLAARLRHAGKMEAVGTLARGIAHDFNNILATVQASLYIMEKKIDKENLLYNQVLRMNNSIARAKELIQSLLAFSRGQTVLLAPVEINRFIERMGPTIRGLTGDEISYSAVLWKGPLVVNADILQLQRVIINLVANARDAMPDGGALSLRAERAAVAEGRGAARPGVYAVIAVTDSGDGIPADIIERIFEPFFTTKAVGQGMGLGLSIVYGIIEQHMGFITAVSVPAGGAEFRIYLPLSDTDDEIIREESEGRTDGESSDN